MKYYAIHFNDYIKECVDEDEELYSNKIISNQGWIYSTIYKTREEAANELIEDGFKEINYGFYILDTKEVRYEVTIESVKVKE